MTLGSAAQSTHHRVSINSFIPGCSELLLPLVPGFLQVRPTSALQVTWQTNTDVCSFEEKFIHRQYKKKVTDQDVSGRTVVHVHSIQLQTINH